MKNALAIVQEFFPDVTSVADAKDNITVEVTKRDSNSAQVRNHKACAMAVACKRKMQADGVIVAVSTAYVINGKKAHRCEVISFDRNGGFAEGEYSLRSPSKCERLGNHAGGSTPNTGTGKRVKYHHTSGIRTVLGSKLQ